MWLLLIKNIKKLVQVEDTPREMVAGKDMASLNTIANAYLLIEDNIIADFGTMENLPEHLQVAEQRASHGRSNPQIVQHHTDIRPLRLADRVDVLPGGS